MNVSIRYKNMINPIADIHDYQVSNLVNKLLSFLGRKEVEKCLQKYSTSLRSSGPVFGEYYLKNRHPWWNAISEFFEIQKSGKSIRRNLTEGLKILAADAKKIIILGKLMPESIRDKYRRDLVDDNRARDYLLELQIAWHFFLKGYEIKWHDAGSGSHSEFLIKAPELEFNVECKRISVDASKRIRRRDFYRLAEKVIPKIELMDYSGAIDIVLKDRLHGNDRFLNELASQVINKVSTGRIMGVFQIPLGSLYLELVPANKNPVDLYDRFNSLWKRKPQQAHGAIFARSHNGRPIDPVEMTLVSDKSDRVLDGIRERISKARKAQLDESKPALIVCFLEGITDLRELATDSGLQIMTCSLLAKESFSHIAAIAYSSETLVEKSSTSEKFFNQGLIFDNPNCKFKNAKEFQFLSGF